MGVERSSFVIGPDGKIEHVLERVKPMEHVDLLLGALAA
jgi:peroxiredoxin Q/BCP